MFVQLNFRSGVPVYLQVAQQVKAAAASGALRPGDALPSVRALAEELRINRNTAAKAYAELEAEGVLELRQGSGCFLKANATVEHANDASPLWTSYVRAPDGTDVPLPPRPARLLCGPRDGDVHARRRARQGGVAQSLAIHPNLDGAPR